MSEKRPVYFWVLGYREWHDLRLIEALRFGHRFSWEHGTSAAWYAHKSQRTQYLAPDALSHVHISGLSWRWRVNPAAKYPPPPFLLTDDPCLFPAFEGSVGIRPERQANGWLTSGLVQGSAHDVVWPVVGAGWLGVLSVVRGKFARGRGHLTAFSPTGEVPEGVCAGVAIAHFEAPFGAIEFPARKVDQ